MPFLFEFVRVLYSVVCVVLELWLIVAARSMDLWRNTSRKLDKQATRRCSI